MRAAIYTRISQGDDNQTATRRQQQDCEEFCKRQGWEVVDVYEDIDISAFDRKKTRPAFESMIKAVEAREIDVVVAWHLDRLSRQPATFIRLMDALEDAKAFVATVDGTDTRTDAGAFVASILVGHAKMSSQDSARRIKRKHRELALAGRLGGVGKRSFGYTFKKETKQLEVVEDEAHEIVDAYRRILDEGARVHTVLKDWIARGIHAPGTKWHYTSFRNMLTSARIAGCREVDGALVTGTWPPIITPEMLLQVRNTVTGKNGQSVATARAYLLSGMCRCGRCGSRMISRRDSRGKRRYACVGILEEKGCGGVVRMAEPVEELVKQAVLIALDGVDLAAYVAKPTTDCEDVPALIAADEDKLAEIAIDYADGKVTKPEWYAFRDRISARLEANRKKLHKANGHGKLARFVGAGVEVAESWDQHDLDWRRAVISAVVDHVDIMPQLPGANRKFNPDLIRIIWKF